MVVLGTQTKFSLSNPEKIVVRAAVSQFCEETNAARRISRAIESPSRETGRIIISGDDARTLVSTLQSAINRIHAETGGRGQQTCQALSAVIGRISGS